MIKVGNQHNIFSLKSVITAKTLGTFYHLFITSLTIFVTAYQQVDLMLVGHLSIIKKMWYSFNHWLFSLYQYTHNLYFLGMVWFVKVLLLILIRSSDGHMYTVHTTNHIGYTVLHVKPERSTIQIFFNMLVTLNFDGTCIILKMDRHRICSWPSVGH